MRILVTGANGFIGSHLVEALVKKNHDVIAFCEYNSFASRGWLDKSSFRSDFRTIFGDIRDAELVNDSVKNLDAVLHLAALISIPYSYRAPRSYLDVNVVGTQNILEAARKNEVRVIHTSTSEVYGTPEAIPITERNSIKPQSPYAASKAAADHLVTSYVKSFGIKALIMRPFNTYGPRQSARAIIPTILSQALSNNLIYLGNVAPQRDLTFVSDTVEAFECALKYQDIFDGRVIQLGFGKTISVRDLVGLIGEVIKRPLEINVDANRERVSTSEVDILLSDPSYAKESIEWSAKVSLREGLQRTWDWVQDYKDSYFQNPGYTI